MRITLYGAAGEVTGSAYLVETGGVQMLVDFGMFQGVDMAERRNRVPSGLRVRELDAVLLTHCHLDHVGRLPLLTRRGFNKRIYATPGTVDLTDLILRDAAKIQASDNTRINRKRERQGKPPVAPLFDLEDVERVLKAMERVPYDEEVEVAPGVRARFAEAGHILGSTSIQLIVRENGVERVVVFSGDLGPIGVPILKDYECLQRADLVFMESTYGDRDHRSQTETVAEFRGIITRATERKGKILVPTFAVGRAQLILYHLAGMFREGVVPKFPVFLDSPMAIEATKIYARHPELFDEEALALRRNQSMRHDLSSLELSVSADDSRALNDVPGPCVIMAGAGMCNAGRILHHLRHNLWQPETWVLIVGYQGEGSLGRQLLEGRKTVKIFGERIAVKAKVRSLGGFSAHAGQTDLLRWLECLAPAKPKVILTHGEAKGRDPLAQLISERYGLSVEKPQERDVVEL